MHADGLVRRCIPARSKTTPAKVLSGAAQDALEELKPPRTPSVQQQLLEGGPTTTMLDLALGIVQRLTAVEENDTKELDFLETCLKVGHSKTTLPCALLEKHESRGEVQDMLLNMYADSRPPLQRAHTYSTSMRSRSRVSSRVVATSNEGFEAFGEEGPPVVPMPSSLDEAGEQELRQLLDNEFDAWSFDSFRLATATCGRPLVFAGHEALRRNNLYHLFDIEPDKAQLFLSRVEDQYGRQPAVPYHNNVHAADVTQGVHALIGEIGFHSYIDNLSSLTIVFSAVIHDMGHDGRNNNFHVNVQDEMALTYNDKSVLENFHVSQAFRMLAAEPEANFLACLGLDRFVTVRKQAIEVVLGTDMAHHFSHLSSFKAAVQKLPESDPEGWTEDAEAASTMRVMILHACDTSNPAKTLQISDHWTALLRDEFFQQGEAEKSLGLPFSPLCDRETVKFASSQVGFMQFIVRPTFELFSPLVPKVKEVILKEVDENLEVWMERKQREANEAVSKTRAATTGTAALVLPLPQ